jgi:hypothetical protein
VKVAESSSGHLLLVLNTAAFYVRETVLPFSNISPLHPYQAEDLFSPTGVMTAIAAALAVLAVVVLAIRRNRGGMFAVAILVALLPVLNLIPLTIGKSIGHDRFLATALVFFAIGIAQIDGQDIRWFRTKAQYLATGLVVVAWTGLAAVTVRTTVPLWSTEVSLWSWTYHKHPKAVEARTHLLEAGLGEGRYDLLKPVIEEMLREGPLEARDQIRYAGYLFGIGNVGEAKNYLRGVLDSTEKFHEEHDAGAHAKVKAMGMSLELAYAYNLLAMLQVADGEYPSALESVRAALWYQPRIPAILLNESNILLTLNLVAESEALLEESRQLFLPTDRPAMDAARTKFIASVCRKTPTLSMCWSRQNDAPGNV